MSISSPGSQRESIPIPRAAQQVLLEDAVGRNIVTARRIFLMALLRQQSYFSRLELIERVEAQLGSDCFGPARNPATFYRDMQVVRKALAATGYVLGYSRRPGLVGYYIKGTAAAHQGVLVRASQEKFRELLIGQAKS